MLSTTLSSIPLSSCLGNASGCYSSTYEQFDELNTVNCFITSKSATVKSQNGNQHPRLYIDKNICINSMGLPNEGIKYYTQYSSQNTFILSVYPYHVNDLDELFDNKHQIIEVNLSCPNINNIINDYECFFNKINHIKGQKIVGIKLPPMTNKQHIIDLSQLLIQYNINFITCSNTIPHCLVIKDDKEVLHNVFGGMSLKSLSLSNVYQFYKLLQNKVDIIGCGGIQKGQDTCDYILCGATAVQIGSQLLREGVDGLMRIENELKDIMNKKHYKNINEFKGLIHLHSKL